MASWLYSLTLKTGVQGQEALAHKGGIVLPIWKGKQGKDQCASFRSILLSSSAGKVMHKSLRTKQLDLYQRFLHPQQLGGRTGVPVVLGSHFVRAFNDFATNRKYPAHCSMWTCKKPSIGLCASWLQAIALMASRLQLGDDCLHELYAELAKLKPHALGEARLPDHMQHAIKALHTDTFLQLQSQQDYVVTQIGSRPGD